MDEQPARGGDKSGQALDVLTNYTLLAHGAKENLREMSIIKGQKKRRVLARVQGRKTNSPSANPVCFRQVYTQSSSFGRVCEKDEEKFQLMAMTDKEIEEMSSGKIEDARLIKAPDLTPEKGGLFDPDVTGGPGGSKWSHIELAEPIPNPVFKDAIISLLDMTTKEFESVLKGEKYINGKTGGQAIEDALSKINVKKELAEAKNWQPAEKSVPNKDLINFTRRFVSWMPWSAQGENQRIMYSTRYQCFLRSSDRFTPCRTGT